MFSGGSSGGSRVLQKVKGGGALSNDRLAFLRETSVLRSVISCPLQFIKIETVKPAHPWDLNYPIHIKQMSALNSSAFDREENFALARHISNANTILSLST